RRRAPERAALATAFVGRPLQLRGARARRRRVDAPAAAQARMEEHVRMTTTPARDLWLLRAKYAVFGIAIAAGLALLQETHALAALNDVVNQCLELAARFGAPGMFAAGVLGNASILVQIPYSLPLLSVALDGATLPHLVVLGLACGVGAGVGEIISYLIADAILTRAPGLPDSRVYRWIERNTEKHPLLTKLAIFVWAVTPLPDDTVIVPLPMVNYGR